MVMLLTVAWMTASNWRSRTAHFFFMFGVWDILYYIGLKWFAHWPASWLQWDCLFLIPKPWYGPVLAPVLISAYFMIGCCLLLARENSRTKPPLSLAALALQLPGFLVWYWSFVKDSDLIQAHGYDGISYSWSLFACGLIIAGLGWWLATRWSPAGLSGWRRRPSAAHCRYHQSAPNPKSEARNRKDAASGELPAVRFLRTSDFGLPSGFGPRGLGFLSEPVVLPDAPLALPTATNAFDTCPR